MIWSQMVIELWKPTLCLVTYPAEIFLPFMIGGGGEYSIVMVEE